MKGIIISCVLFFFALSTRAQTSPAKDDDMRTVASVTTKADSLNLALYVMNEIPVSRTYINSIPNKIESLHYLRGHDAIALYGDKAKYGAVLVILKSQYKEEILNVPAKDFR